MLNVYTTPKFMALLVGGAALAPLLVAWALREGRSNVLVSPFALALAALVTALGVSTMVSADPKLAFLGTFTSRMGLVTYLAYAACAIAVLIVVDRSPARFGRLFVWHVLIGAVVAGVCILQITGAIGLYPAGFTPGEDLPRVHGTVGHPDYTGNYLLYVVFPALGMAYGARGVIRGFGIATAAAATLAILYTGTRGAWVGLAVGVCVAGFFTWRAGLLGRLSPRARIALGGGLVAASAASAAILVFSASAAPIRARLLAFATEGFTGAGRTNVWRFTLGLIPKFWLFGCGPDMFKLVQTPYKTLEYVQATGGVNVEDPHNAYLSMLLTGGVFAFTAYVALIVLALRGLPRAILSASARRESRDEVALGIAVLASLVAGLSHDLFLHHLSVNGLVFFVFLAFGFAWSRMSTDVGATSPPAEPQSNTPLLVWVGAIFAALVLPFACVHAWNVARADVFVARTMRAAENHNARAVQTSGDGAVAFRLPQPDYHFYYAVALEQLARASTEADERNRYFHAALDQASLAVDQPIPPVPYVAFVGSLAVQAGELDRAREAIDRARRMDPFSYHAELSALQAALAEGDIDEAVRRCEHVELMASPYEELAKARLLVRDAIRKQKTPRTDLQREFLGHAFQHEHKRRSQ